ncbi:hypothetical protein O6H91_05G070200 [Diphasiastrum complanatum]|uniref:Uncharacterized protein n=1 Tax=Diphasiastrum complanatum TaxID=34168 RepID=A0ACC2DPK0_DIPCM|nr:hypothetical protein O6H91_05G070200 [Diphasiastrum complanatum]
MSELSSISRKCSIQQRRFDILLFCCPLRSYQFKRMKFSRVILCVLSLLFLSYQAVPTILGENAIAAGSLLPGELQYRRILKLPRRFSQLHERNILHRAPVQNLIYRKLAGQVAKAENHESAVHLNFEAALYPAPITRAGHGGMEDLHQVPSTPNPIQNGNSDNSHH